MRRCLLSPIPEFALAADLLSLAADALLAGDLVTCADRLREADLRPLRDFAYRVAGPLNPEIHRQTKNPSFEPVPKEGRPRMPGESATLVIFKRDGFRCRFCESRVIVKGTSRIFHHYLPDATRLGSTNETTHFGLSTLTASLDHLVPYSRGGNNDEENLVTACGPCQYGRNQFTLDEVELLNPLERPPILDHWDGLTRLRPLARRPAPSTRS
jgi:hypothetical protein